MGTLSDKGAQIRPGLTKEMYDAAVAFTDWCNDQGGILGRKLSLTDLDAALFNYPSAITKGCEQDFALVGGGAALDSGGNGAREKCGLPNIAGYTVSAQARAEGLQVQPLPVPVDRDPVGPVPGAGRARPRGHQAHGLPHRRPELDHHLQGRRHRSHHPHGLQGGARPQVRRHRRVELAALRGGHQEPRTCRSSSSWASPRTSPRLQKAMKTVGYYPKYTLQQANFYDSKYAAEGGSTAKDTYVRVGFYPFELAKDNQATQDYLDIMKQYNPSGKIAALGAQGMSAWLLFATAARECGSNLTRECLLEKAKAVTKWTGGGLHGQSNPGGLEPTPCFVSMKLDGDKFVYDKKTTDADTGIYNCNPAERGQDHQGLRSSAAPALSRRTAPSR